jgi:hypothetical protein
VFRVFFFEKMQILLKEGRKEEHRTTLFIKRDESERKEEEERERVYGDFEMISSKRSSFSFLNFFPKALFLFLFSLALSESCVS